MRYPIKEHKGQQIYYDDYNDKFVCDIELGDNLKSAKRGKLSDIEREIDLFIKANFNFVPFTVVLKNYRNKKTMAKAISYLFEFIIFMIFVNSDSEVVLSVLLTSTSGTILSSVIFLPFGVNHLATVTLREPPFLRSTNSCTLPLP